jgi:hypothetical protein
MTGGARSRTNGNHDGVLTADGHPGRYTVLKCRFSATPLKSRHVRRGTHGLAIDFPSRSHDFPRRDRGGFVALAAERFAVPRETHSAINMETMPFAVQ